MLYAKHNPIEVYIQSVEKGTRYKEYLRNDDGTLSDDESRICYIEAVDDDQYSIAVVLQRGFRYRRAQGIRIVFKIDDVVYESNFQEKSSSSKNCVTTAQTYFKESTYTAVDDQWELATFRFGKLALDEDIEADDKDSAIGRITVSVQRGKEVTTQLKRPRNPDTTEAHCLPDTSFEATMSKSVFKQGISHSTRLVGTGKRHLRSTSMSSTSTRFVPLGRTHGREFVFEFYYRSRMTLQHLGKIPFTPIIEPQQDTVSSDSVGNTEAQTATAAQAGDMTDGGLVSDSRQQLPSVKREPLPDFSSAQPAAPTIAQTGDTANGGSAGDGGQKPSSVKRELSPNSPNAPPAAPPAKRTKTVDLTLVDSPPLSVQQTKQELKRETPLVPLRSIPTLDLAAEEHDNAPVIKNESGGHAGGAGAASGTDAHDDMDEEALRLKLEEIQVRLRLKQMEKSKARPQL